MRPCMVSLKSSKSILKYSLSDGEHSPDGEPVERQRMASQANLTLPVMMSLTNQILIGILAPYWL